MKKKEFFVGLALIALCIGFFSCSYEYVPESRGLEKKELIPVSFTVEFAKEITGLRASEAVNFKDFLYLVYDAGTGKLYKDIKYTNFEGIINDSLPEGNYTVVFAGATQATYLWYYSDTNMTSFIEIDAPPPLGGDTNISRFNRNTDVFYKKINCIVEKNKQNGSAVTLDRIVGKVEIVLEDVIPNDVSTIEVALNFPITFHYLSSPEYVTGSSYSKRINIAESDKVAGYSVFFISFENINQDQSRYPLSITLTARKTLPAGVVDTGQSIIATKVINNVDVLKNKTVRYTGKLFDNITPSNTTPSSSFSISVNEAWGETIGKTF